MAMYYQGVKSNSYGASAGDSDTIFNFQTVVYGGDIGPNISVVSIDTGSVSNMNTNGASSGGYRMNFEVQLNGVWYLFGYITVSGQYSAHQTFSNFTDVATAEVKSLMGKVAPTGLRGNVVAGYFHANAGSVLNINATTKVDTSPVTPPTSLALSATLSEGAVTLYGAGAGGGVGNSIAGYQIQYQDSADGTNWGAWTGYDTVYTGAGSFSYAVSPTGTRGHYRRFRARTIGSAGEAYYSGWAESGSVRKNQAPIAPASTSASPPIYESGYVTVSWPAGSDPDGGALTYNVYYVYSGGSWVHFATTPNLSTIFAPSIERGSWVAFHVAAVDSFGVSASGPTSNMVYRNKAPITPMLILPVANGTTHSTKPSIIATLAAEPDGQNQALEVSIDGGAYVYAGTTTGAGGTLTYTPTLSAGTHMLSLRAYDELGAQSGTTTRTITVSTPSWSRSIETGTIISNETISHRTDITELLARINTVRVFYGLANASLPGTVGKWADWQGQMQALQTALGACFTAAKKTVPSWYAVPAYPTASIINQLRSQIGVV